LFYPAEVINIETREFKQVSTKGKNLTMSKWSFSSDLSGFLNKNQLVNLKTNAKRSGVWFKVLQRIDGVLFDLTIRVVVNVRSHQLAKSMLVFIRKLENGLKGGFSSGLVEIGLPLAQKISSVAQKLGNLSATAWSLYPAFIRFLTGLHINDFRLTKRSLLITPNHLRRVDKR